MADKLEGIGGLVTDQISMLDHARKILVDPIDEDHSMYSCFLPLFSEELSLLEHKSHESDTQVSGLHLLRPAQEVESKKRTDGVESVGGKSKFGGFYIQSAQINLSSLVLHKERW